MNLVKASRPFVHWIQRLKAGGSLVSKSRLTPSSNGTGITETGGKGNKPSKEKFHFNDTINHLFFN